MSKISPLAPLLDIHSLPLDRNDLTISQQEEIGDIDVVDTNFVNSFDVVWWNIMKERGSTFIGGKHESNIIALQDIAITLKQSKDDIKTELKQQTLFVRNHRDQIELKYQQLLQDMKHQGIMLDEKLNQKKDMISNNIIKSTKITTQWKHFMSELDQKRTTAMSPKSTKSFPDDEEDGRGLSKNNHKNTIDIITSSREKAIRLINLYQNVVDKSSDDNTNDEYRIMNVENVLLKTHLKMLQMELELYKSKQTLQSELSIILKEIHNA